MSPEDRPHAEDEAMAQAEAKQVEMFNYVAAAIRSAKAAGFPVEALAAEDDVKPDAVVGDKLAESANPYRLGYDIWLHAAEKMKAKHPDASDTELLRRIGQDEIAESMKALGIDKPLDQQHVIVISDGEPKGITEVASYEGFPVRYPDWKFGMEYEEIMPLPEAEKTIIRDHIVKDSPVIIYCLDGYDRHGNTLLPPSDKKFPHIPFEGILAEVDGVKKIVDPHNGIEMKDDGDVVCVVDPLWDKDKRITIDHQHPKVEGAFVNAAVEKEPVKRKFYSRLGVMDRDNYRCRFCGQDVSQDSTRNMPCRDAVICHLLVLARGGTHSYENCVTSCKVCCEKKGHMTPEEAKMPLLSLDHPMFTLPNMPKNFINDGTPESEFIKDLLGIKKADPAELSSDGMSDPIGRPYTEKDDPRNFLLSVAEFTKKLKIWEVKNNPDVPVIIVDSIDQNDQRTFTMTGPLHDMEFIKAVIDAEPDTPTVIVDGKVVPAGEYVAEQIGKLTTDRGGWLRPVPNNVDQPVIIAAGNEELLSLKHDKARDVLLDRVVRIDVPYLLKWEEEIKLFTQNGADLLAHRKLYEKPEGNTPPKNQVQIED